MSAPPRLIWLRQHRSGPVVDDPAARTSDALASLSLSARVRDGQTVAIAVGSRGIADLEPVVRATVSHLRGLGLEPFVVPAMGSHGGGDAPGQSRLLSGYGITEERVGCPVRSQMDTIELCRSRLGFPVHLDALAAAADHVVVVNRVKPHTVFDGEVESGLAKMLLIGLGKRAGAETYHRAAFDHDWSRLVSTVTPEVLAHVSLLAAVAIVENADDRTARIEAVTGDDLLRREPELLAEARELLPRLPFDDFEVVLIDRIGKDVSGAGWDVNTLGRKGALHEVDPTRRPRVRTVVIRGLTAGTHGNAMGVGLAELCRTRVIEQMDREATWVNAQTSGDIPAGMLPIHHATDRELLDACRTRNGLRELHEARIGWIHTTLDLRVLAVSEHFADEAAERDDLEVLAGPLAMPLDERGNLPDDVRDIPA